jgi:sulfur-oxidizing protein SoxZ
MWTARVVVPKQARKGEVIDVKCLVTHPMETGYRRDNKGAAIPRDIITRFTCAYAGEEVFAMDLFTGVAANPFVAFTTVATETGDVVLTWTDQHGRSHSERARVVVT